MKKITEIGALEIKRIVRPRGYAKGAKIYRYYHTITYEDLQAVDQFIESGITQECLLLLNNGRPMITPEDKAQMKERFIEILNELAERTKRGEISAYFPLPAKLLGSFSLVRDEGGSPGD